MLESFNKNKRGILIMCFSSIFVCIGQLFWKVSAENGVVPLFLGFLFYGIGAMIMIIAYKYGSLSVLQPVLSLNYVFSIILASIFLNEQITNLKVTGVVIIIIGVVMIAGGDK
ncbi:EamA family transporter [Sedimentibacter saalensis]|uniref:EamA family transporter n=1 Tax=Sedimentibacter saalensis TaxID=130788 RepID=UPI00289E3EC8|nr:EamA family transporter [Sedimentibacter saalensis]